MLEGNDRLTKIRPAAFQSAKEVRVLACVGIYNGRVCEDNLSGSQFERGKGMPLRETISDNYLKVLDAIYAQPVEIRKEGHPTCTRQYDHGDHEGDSEAGTESHPCPHHPITRTNTDIEHTSKQKSRYTDSIVSASYCSDAMGIKKVIDLAPGVTRASPKNTILVQGDSIQALEIQ